MLESKASALGAFPKLKLWAPYDLKLNYVGNRNEWESEAPLRYRNEQMEFGNEE
jgi:hypothetical protein